MSERIVIVVQARTGSSRLPNKVMMPVAGEPCLQRQLERVAAATQADAVVCATTWEPNDQVIVDLCKKIGMPVYAGHPTDLLDRHYHAAKEHKADVVVKIPSDCPLIDPAVIDRVLKFWRDHPGEYDFVSNVHPATYPDGYDVEVMPWPLFEQAHKEATKPHEREHTTPWFWDQPDRFRVGNVVWETGLDYSMSHRFTIDYPEDYTFICRVYDELWTPERPMFTLGEIVELVNTRRDIYEINAHLAGVNWYRHHIGELNTITAAQTKVI